MLKIISGLRCLGLRNCSKFFFSAVEGDKPSLLPTVIDTS